jgi:hypothetical protein
VTIYFRDRDLKKECVSANVESIVPVYFNETDVDRMMTHLAERIIRGGLTLPAKRITNSQRDKGEENRESLDKHRIDQLASHQNIEGFSSQESKKVLEGWVRASLVNLVASGKGRSQGEIIDYLVPLTAAIYRTGLPTQTSRHRKTDVLAYGSMLKFLRDAGSKKPDIDLMQLGTETLANGLSVGAYPYGQVKSDRKTRQDIETLLEIYFAETFEPIPTGPKHKAPPTDWQLLIPGGVEPLGQDLVAILLFAKLDQDSGSSGPVRWSVPETVRVMSAIASIRLFQLPLRLGRGLRAFLESQAGPDLADEIESDGIVRWSNPSEMFCDFTNEVGSPSDLLSRKTVGRDLGILQTFFDDRMTIRAFEVLWPRNSDRPWRQSVEVTFASQDFNSALRNIRAAWIDGKLEETANDYMLRLSNQFSLTDENAELSDAELSALNSINELQQRSQTDFEAFQRFLVAVNSNLGLSGLDKWFKTVTGFSDKTKPKPYAVLRGNSSKQSWRYTISDDLLLSLVFMCFAEHQTGPGALDAIWSKRLRLSVLIDRLENRFGILINKIPAGMDSPSSRQAVVQNLEAFKKRLSLLGCFDDLSDDIAAQYVRRPL